jgi:hypothetical protein
VPKVDPLSPPASQAMSKKRQRKSGTTKRRQVHTPTQPAREHPVALDPSLPSTRAELEAAQKEALRRMAEGPPAEVGAVGSAPDLGSTTLRRMAEGPSAEVVDETDEARTVRMTDAQVVLMKLQPGPRDPILWIRTARARALSPWTSAPGSSPATS